MLVSLFHFANIHSVKTVFKQYFSSVSAMFLAIVVSTSLASSQSAPKSQEISDVDGQPVLLKHLPAYESVQPNAVFGTDKRELEKTIGEKPVLAHLEFPPGTEFVTAQYPQGRLLIIEYTNPQSSLEADGRIQQYFNSRENQSGEIYRRIGNYNAFVFDVADANAASGLLDQIKYEKTVQWLGEDPYILKKLERYMVTTSKDIMISTVFVILLGLATSILAGIAAGFIFFRVRDQKRAHRTAFSDAGGLTRLNLDGLSE
jgi:hypothetical protein